MKPPYFSPMASHRRCIVLEEEVHYDSFPAAAARWATTLELEVHQKIDGPDARLWVCEKNGAKFWQACDEWFSAICLEPQDAEAGEEIVRIGEALKA